jgi:hypothetical protein
VKLYGITPSSSSGSQADIVPKSVPKKEHTQMGETFPNPCKDPANPVFLRELETPFGLLQYYFPLTENGALIIDDRLKRMFGRYWFRKKTDWDGKVYWWPRIIPAGVRTSWSKTDLRMYCQARNSDLFP